MRELLAALDEAECRATYEVFGVRLVIAADTVILRDQAAKRLPWSTVPTGDRPAHRRYTLRMPRPCKLKALRDVFLLFADGRLIGRAPILEDILDTIEHDALRFVPARCRQRFFVHAAVAAFGESGVLLPGPSGSGKTTMAVALGKLGATLYSDEFAVLDRRGRAHPFAQPLSFKSRSDKPPRKKRPEDLGLAIGKAPIKIRLCLFFSYRRSGGWRAKRLSAAQGVMEAAAHSLSLASNPRPTLHALHVALAGADSLVVVRGDAEGAARRVRRMLERM